MLRMAACLAVGLLMACQAPTNGAPGAAPATGATIRVQTIPAGANVRVQRLLKDWTSPCELPAGVRSDERIIVSLRGYSTWTGTLADMTSLTRNSYQLRLALE